MKEDNSPNGGQIGGAAKEKPRRKRRVVLFTLLCLAGILLIVAGVYYNRIVLNPGSLFTPTPTARAIHTPAPAPTKAADMPTPTPEPTLSPEEQLKLEADLEFMKNKVNILMLGWDQSPEREEEDSALYRDEKNNYRSDVIILLTVDFESKTADLISIPRDTYAPIYNTKGRWKINAAFAHGGSVEGEGFLYAMNTVSDLLGVPIEYYAGVDMIGLKAVVDAMGGVDYDVDVQIKLNGRVLNTGFQHLDGQQVLDYCRARKGISTDVGRADRQQRMLFAIFEQLKSRDQLVNIPSIYSSVQDKIITNLSLEQIAALSVFALSLDMEHLNRHTLAGQYIDNVGSSSASFYVLHNSKLKALVKEVFGIDIKTNPRYDVGYVKGEKASSQASSYITGAEYLLGVFSGASGAARVQSELSSLKSLMAVEASLEAGVDATAIDSTCGMLKSAMFSMCAANGITRESINKSSVPSDFYASLPEAGQTAQPAAASEDRALAPVPDDELPIAG